MSRSFILSQIYAFITVALWSTVYVFTKISLLHFSAPVLGLLRCAVASACLAAVVVVKKIPPPEKKFFPLFVLSGIMGFTLYIITFNIGSSSLNAATSCIIISATPIITALLAAAFFQERLSILGWTATGIAFCGILIIFLWDGFFSISVGLAWMLISAVLLSGYNILQRKLSTRFSPLQITSYSFFCGSFLLLIFLPEATAQLRTAPAHQLGIVVFLGIFPSAVAYVFWGKALAIAPKTGNVTNYMFLTPFLALMLEYVVTGDLPGIATFVGGGVILAGLVLFSVAARHKT